MSREEERNGRIEMKRSECNCESRANDGDDDDDDDVELMSRRECALPMAKCICNC